MLTCIWLADQQVVDVHPAPSTGVDWVERVFNVAAVKPTYRLALLTALAFLIVAPLPLQMHLGHPERSWEMYVTPHTTSAMAMFGFVYLWYLMVVLVLEIWFDYRQELVLKARASTGLTRLFYRVLTLGNDNISPEALRIDHRIGGILTVIGIPSAFMLHGYVGFIFGSIKANPWWSTPLMPIVFLFSAIVSGIAAVMLIYMATCKLRKVKIDMLCVDTIAKYLFYAFIVDFTLSVSLSAVTNASSDFPPSVSASRALSVSSGIGQLSRANPSCAASKMAAAKIILFFMILIKH